MIFYFNAAGIFVQNDTSTTEVDLWDSGFRARWNQGDINGENDGFLSESSRIREKSTLRKKEEKWVLLFVFFFTKE